MRCVWIILAIWLATAAHGGPWLRQVSTGFLSTGSTVTISPIDGTIASYSGLYLEYGRSAEETLVFSGGVNESNTISGHLFLRRPISTWESGWLGAYEIGIGGSYFADQLTPEIRLGLTLGRGITIRRNNGWLTLDTSLKMSKADLSLMTEMTVGITTEKRWKWIGQITAEKAYQKPTYFSFSPSVAIPLGKQGHLQVGLIGNTRDGGRVGIKTSIWREF